MAATGLAACGILSPIGPPPAMCQFPDGVPLSFAGETTLGEVGLASPGGEDLPAKVWITAEPILYEPIGRTTRMFCAVEANGSTSIVPFPVEPL